METDKAKTEQYDKRGIWKRNNWEITNLTRKHLKHVNSEKETFGNDRSEKETV